MGFESLEDMKQGEIHLEGDRALDTYPEFSINYKVDEENEVTLYSSKDEDSIYTAWIAANKGYTVDLTDIR